MNMILDRKAGWAFLLSALMATATACGLGQSKGEPGSSSSKGGSSQGIFAFSPSNDPRKDLRDALERLNSAYPYRVTQIWSNNANGLNGREIQAVADFAAADRCRVKINDPLGDTEIITIGDKQYNKLNGNWTEGAAASAAPIGGTIEAMRQMLASVIKDVKYAGPETINGVACHAYTYAIDGDMSGQKWLGTARSWIR